MTTTPSPSNAAGRLRATLADELQPAQIVRSLASGALIYVLELIVVLSFAALIFSGDLTGLLPSGFGFLMAGDALVCGVVSILSSWPGSTANTQDTPSAIMAAAAAATVALLPAAVGAEQKLATVLMLIVVTTLTAGVLFLLLGIFKLGGLVRFLPFPVMGGFLAATGWLLFAGGIAVMTAAPLGPALFAGNELVRWLPGLLAGIALTVGMARSNHPLVLPGIIVVAIILFYAAAALSRAPISELGNQGWLVGSVPAGGLLRMTITPRNLALADWSAILANIGRAAPVLVIAPIALLLNANGLELIARRDIALNRELIASGIANLAAGLVGGVIGYHAVSNSALNRSTAGGKRLASLLAALFIGLTVLVGAPFLPYVPKFILGGVLVMLGIGLMQEWIYRAWFKFPKVDFLVIMLIAAVIVWQGFLPGLGAGLLAATILFIVSYSRVSVVKHALRGREARSLVVRSPGEEALLDKLKERLLVLKLHGFVFFGTANSLYERIRDEVRRANLGYIVLDFSQVTGLDATGMLSFEKLRQLAEERKVVLVFTGLFHKNLQRIALADRLARGGLPEQPGVVYVFQDMDRGVEWCEEQLLADAGRGNKPARTLAEHLDGILDAAQLSRLLAHLECREVETGEYLMRQGDMPDDLYIIESGQVTAQIELPDRGAIRLETMQGGRTVGELGFYLGTARNASVVAEGPGRVYRLTRAGLAQMEQADPEAAAALHRLAVFSLGDRLLQMNRTVVALQR